jgi:hypothetical protein
MGERGEAKELKITKKIFTDIAKRRQVNGSVVTPGTPATLYSGRITVRSIVVSNPTSGSQTFKIYDGSTVLYAFTLAAGSYWAASDLDVPFYTSVAFDSSSTGVIFTAGAFAP